MKLSHLILSAALIAMLLMFVSPAGASVFDNSASYRAASSKISVGDRALTLKWSAIKGAASYRVSWRSHAMKAGKPTAAWSKKWFGLKVLKASTRAYKASGLINGRQYQIRLESKTKAKKSRWTVKSTLKATPSASPPDPPTNVVGVAGDGQVIVSWKDPLNNGGSVITSYQVNASGEGGQSCTAEGQGAITCTVTGLTNGTPYTFTVVATSAIGNSVASVASAAVTPATVPGAPTGVSGVAGDGQVVVSWSAPSSNGGSAVTGYTVTASDGVSPLTKQCAASPCTVTGLTNATAYTFTAVATNAHGDSVASVASAAVTPSAPSCANGRAVCVVGDTGPGGGKVFYVLGGAETVPDAPCGSSCRYLEAAPVDWNGLPGSGDPGLAWGGGGGAANTCSTRDISGAVGTGIGSGFANTTAIMADCPDSIGDNSAPAARAASTYAPTVNGVVVRGWFMPSRDELTLLDVSSVGGLTPDVIYWSSSQVYASLAWSQGVGFGGGGVWQDYDYKFSSFQVRAVRAF